MCQGSLVRALLEPQRFFFLTFFSFLCKFWGWGSNLTTFLDFYGSRLQAFGACQKIFHFKQCYVQQVKVGPCWPIMSNQEKTQLLHSRIFKKIYIFLKVSLDCCDMILVYIIWPYSTWGTCQKFARIFFIFHSLFEHCVQSCQLLSLAQLC